VSYQNAVTLLDAQIKEIIGTRPKGKIPLLREEMAGLYMRKNTAESGAAALRRDRERLDALAREADTLKGQPDDRAYVDLYAKAKYDRIARRKTYITQAILAVLLTVGMFFAFPLAMAAGAVWLAFSLFMLLKKPIPKELYEMLGVGEFDQIEGKIKERERTIEQNRARLMEIASLSGDLKGKMNNTVLTPPAVIDEQIRELERQIDMYGKIADDIALAKTALHAAFSELQKGFGRKLNQKTAEVLRAVTDGRYDEVLVDEGYNMLVRAENELRDARYLSGGAYDQIYLSLRLAIISLLFPDMPLILDDALALYDDARMAAAVRYLRALPAQVLLFTCQKREGNVQ
jgi:hypothetical protein